MGPHDFLKHILPTTGNYCLILIKQGLINQQFIDSIPSNEEFEELNNSPEYTGYDMYYAIASFQTPGRRTQANVAQLKSLWIDLDVGTNAPYTTKPEAIKALYDFVKLAGLPAPTTVDSGGGAHVYWPLTHAIDIATWKSLAIALIAKAKEYGFQIKDPGVTTDCARILRVPGTSNYKTLPPRSVKIKSIGKSSDPVQLHTLLDASNIVAIIPKVRTSNLAVNPLTRSLMGHKGQQYGKIIERSMNGTGCVQLTNGYLNQDDLTGMHWWGIMSIPQFTEQRIEGVHNLSYQHSDYSVAATEIKSGRTDGPYSCAKLSEHRPELCAACSHYRNITHPFLLDRTGHPKPIAKELEILDASPIPYPYLINARSGISMKSFVPNKDSDGGSMVIKQVYNHSLYVSGRHLDPHSGELVHLKLLRPHDEVRDFSVPLSDITAKEKCRERLSKEGVAADQYKMGMLMQYITEFCNYLQSVNKAEKIRVQFGWHDNDTCFVVGDREIHKDGIKYTMPSNDTAQAAVAYTKKGELKAWQSVAQLYAAPNNEVRAISLLLGFGCPMFKFLGIGGAILHLVNSLTGVGKSAAQGLGVSVWGHPLEGMSKLNDTLNMRMHRLGVMNNVLFCMDEITLMTNEDLGTLAYSISLGRGKGRMEASVNKERLNTSTWSVPCITSGNSSIHGALQAHSLSPDGQIMRVLELRVEPIVGITKEESDRLFIDVLQNNYGHAGEIIVQYILNNKEECYARLKTIQVQFDLIIGFSNPERFYSVLITTALWGGEIANLLGLVNIPLAPIVEFLLNNNNDTKQEVHTMEQISGGNIGAFINEHSGNHTLVLDTRPSNIPGDFRPLVQTPRGELMIRIELDTHRMYITSTSLRSWCAKRRVSFQELYTGLQTQGALIGLRNIRMAEGAPTPSPAVKALVLDMDKLKEAGYEI